MRSINAPNERLRGPTGDCVAYFQSWPSTALVYRRKLNLEGDRGLGIWGAGQASDDIKSVTQPLPWPLGLLQSMTVQTWIYPWQRGVIQGFVLVLCVCWCPGFHPRLDQPTFQRFFPWQLILDYRTFSREFATFILDNIHGDTKNIIYQYDIVSAFFFCKSINQEFVVLFHMA